MPKYRNGVRRLANQTHGYVCIFASLIIWYTYRILRSLRFIHRVLLFPLGYNWMRPNTANQLWSIWLCSLCSLTHSLTQSPIYINISLSDPIKIKFQKAINFIGCWFYIFISPLRVIQCHVMRKDTVILVHTAHIHTIWYSSGIYSERFWIRMPVFRYKSSFSNWNPPI